MDRRGSFTGICISYRVPVLGWPGKLASWFMHQWDEAGGDGTDGTAVEIRTMWRRSRAWRFCWTGRGGRYRGGDGGAVAGDTGGMRRGDASTPATSPGRSTRDPH
jgi:hypothetical protein